MRRTLLTFACALLPLAAVAQVGDQLSYTYYEVNVRSGKLAPQINAQTPIRQDGVHYARTQWNVSWRFRWNEGPGGCRFTSVNVNLRTEITLPRLNGASPQQAALFERFMPALREHETGHHQIAQEAARAIDAQLRGIPAMDTCPALEAQANRDAQRILERYREKERQYDRDTGHGKTQGAWLND
jgi:predicted secreted Zn-dependent protease